MIWREILWVCLPVRSVLEMLTLFSLCYGGSILGPMLQTVCFSPSLNTADQTRTNAYRLSYRVDSLTSVIPSHTVNSISLCVNGWGFSTILPKSIFYSVPVQLKFRSAFIYSRIGREILRKHLCNVFVDFLECYTFFFVNKSWLLGLLFYSFLD